MNTRPATIFCDIDGTLVKHASPLESSKKNHSMKLLSGTIDKLAEWDRKGYNIILTSGRREGARKETERQLSELGIIYDQLILGIGGGPRHVVNDIKPDGKTLTAFSHNLVRDYGIEDLSI